jgi:hypothetical protein
MKTAFSREQYSSEIFLYSSRPWRFWGSYSFITNDYPGRIPHSWSDVRMTLVTRHPPPPRPVAKNHIHSCRIASLSIQKVLPYYIDCAPNLILSHLLRMSRNDSVGIAAGNGLGRERGRSSSPGMVKNILFSTLSRPALGDHPTTYPVRTGNSFPRGEATGTWSWPITSN